MAQLITYNFTIDDTSPQIVYAPATRTSPAPDLQTSWNQYFDGSGFDAYLGQPGRNESLHITSMDGANFSIAFTGEYGRSTSAGTTSAVADHIGIAMLTKQIGTAIELYGRAVESTFSLVLDDVSASAYSASVARSLNDTSDAAAELLASLSGLPQQDHVLSFTAHTTNTANDTDSLGLVIFDRAVVTVSTGFADASVTTKMINDTDIQFTGSWTFLNDSSFVPEGDHSYHITQTSGDQAQYSFEGVSVELSGLTNATSGLFNISLSSESDPSTVQQQQLSGLSSFLTYTTLFYVSGLDPNVTHTLTITNLENRTLVLDTMNITVMNGGASNTSSAPSTQVAVAVGLSHGVIAGIAVASSLAFLFFLAIIALLLCYRKRRQNCHHARKGGHDVGNVAGPRPLHKRVRSAEGLDVTQLAPGQGLSSPHSVLAGYGYPAANGNQNMVEIVRIEEEDMESDSGLGHVQKKGRSIVSMHSFDNIPQERVSPTRLAARHRSLPLSRWSGWFTSSTRPSSRQHTLAATNVPIVSPRPVRICPPVSVLARAHLRDSQSRRSSSIAREEAFLEVPRTSPFQLDFEKQAQMRNGEPPRMSNTASLSAHARDVLVSFLDFASSGAASLRESSRSRSRRHSGSNKSIVHSGSDDKPASRPAPDSSGRSQTTSTGMWTLSLSVDLPRRSVRESQQLVPTTAVDTIVSTRHPFSMVSADLQVASQESPTDSLPMSVSDINFRAGDDDDDTTAERTARFQLPRHPPLPGTPHSYTFEPAVRPSGFTRASHMRQMSAPNLGMSEQRRPYIAQTYFGRRLAQVRAQALESQASLGNVSQPPARPASPAISEQPGSRPSSSRTRILQLPFIHFGRSTSGS